MLVSFKLYCQVIRVSKRYAREHVTQDPKMEHTDVDPRKADYQVEFM